jgi:RimJ/RimL family protein N-acetyltransferase
MLSPTSVGEALAYLERRPYDNVYVHWLLTSGQLARSGELALWRDESGAIDGHCYAGSQLIPEAGDLAATRAFVERAKRGRSTRMIVGARSSVEPFWRALRKSMPAPAAVRTSQPLYRVSRATLRYSRADADVALATAADLDDIVANSALMIAGEIGGDPRRTNADFRGRTARIIDAGWYWLYRVDGRLAFQCNVGSAMTQTAQIQGVWSPPQMRGHGHAARALGAICDRLLDVTPTLCLYVNDFNLPAIALYERVGFEPVGEFQTILF